MVIGYICRHLEIFELVRLEDERELAARLEMVSIYRLDWVSTRHKQLYTSYHATILSSC